MPVNYATLQAEHRLIREGLDELSAFYEPLNSSERKARIHEFVLWAEARGIDNCGVCIKATEPYGLGLVASGNLDSGNVVVRVPVSAILSVDKAQKSDMLRRVYENDDLVSKMDNVCLSLMLACEKLKGEKSEWAPYINMLPANFETPLYFTDEQLESLKPSPLYDEALHFYRNIARQYIYFLLKVALTSHRSEFNNPLKKKGESPVFVNTPFTVNNFSYQLYRWCVSCVSTRVNVIPSEDKRKPKMLTCLIPFMDMANHLLNIDAKEEAVYFDAEGQYAGIITQKSYKAGEPVYIHYGKRSNWQFFLHNGFVPEQPNPYDIYKLKMGFRKTDPLLQARLLRLRFLCGDSVQSNSSNVFVFTVTSDPPHIDQSLLEFARAFVAPEPKKIETTQEEELKALKFLADRFGLLVKQYTNLPVEPPNDDQVAVFVWRLKTGEKLLLRNVATYIENRLKADCCSNTV
uniref:protein-histidine N-methyltransferase n=1 Tax=Steinernema glaseri TaxID=37863 RepID=A0A1I7ZK58_9BILA